MNIYQRIAEAPSTIRWHRSRLWTNLILRRAFAHIGTGTVLVAPETLRNVDRISIGDGCALQERVWLACEDPTSTITIGDRVVFGRDCHVHAGGNITIGSDTQLGPGTMILSAAKDRNDLREVVAQDPIVIGDNVWIGDHCAVLGGVTIGDGATVGAGSVVTHDVLPHGTVAGSPARPIRSSQP